MKASPHRHTPAIIKLSAIENNVKKMREHIGDKPELWAVVKANAYGHGAIAVAQHIDGLVDGFCVSNFDEAIELRQQLIIKPILVLSGIVPDHAEIAASQHITLTAPSLEWLEQVIDSNKNKHFSRLRIHIAVDTGMGRIGVTTAEEANQIIELADKYNISVRGVFTHYATADEADTQQSEEQKRKFDTIVSQLIRRPKYVHSSNSAAGIWKREQMQDIERIGLAMYGLNPSGDALDLPYELEPALSLQSELTHVKMIKKGDTVGYGATFRAEEDAYVGTVSIGYADGWTRDMQGFKVLVEGKFCEIIGRVSMDQMTILLPKAYPMGTLVTLIGKNGEYEITAQDIAEWRKTINYEVLCSLSDRIYRVYES